MTYGERKQNETMPEAAEISNQARPGTARAKDIPLEALRGIAAVVVVLNHSILAFLPQYYGFGPGGGSQSLGGSLAFVFINGTAAVCLFFVLSGYVLTRRYCLSGNPRILLKGVVKRWPRLMGPVFVTVLLSYALFYFHLYHYRQAGAVSGSPWLSLFGLAFFRPSAPPLTTAAIHLHGALVQGAFLTFFRGDALFDSSLWTMRPEFAGSLIAFGAAPLLLDARKISARFTIGVAALVVMLLHFAQPELEAFPIGTAMAVLLPHRAVLPRIAAWPVLLLSLYLLGYPGRPEGAYTAFGGLVFLGMPACDPLILGAALLIGVVETFPPLRRLFSGRLPAILGELSFPVYLLHVLVICTAGSAIYLRYGALSAIVTVFIVTLAAAVPLARFNGWWVARVNAGTDVLLTPRRPAAVPESASVSAL